MDITMLGTGNALVTEYYNTCFVINDNEKHFMVDGGGGSTVLHQLKHAGLDWMNMREIFVTHKHIDHLMGIVWMIRMICQFMNQGTYKGEANIYAHDEVICLLRDMSYKLLQKKDTRFIDDRLHFITVADGDEHIINGRKVTFFDIRSTKAKQYGFCMELDSGGKADMLR
jgi:ribonuclease Z